MEYPLHAPPGRQEQIEQGLRLCPIFMDWPADRLQELAGSANLAHYRRRTQLSAHGSHRRDIFVVVSGSIEVAATNADGNKYIQSVLGPGQVTRLVHLLEDVPSLYACHAREDSQVIRVPGAAMRRILEAEPALWHRIALLMLRRYSLSARVHHHQMLGSVRRRVATTLIRMAHRYGDQEIGAGSTVLRFSQTDLGNMLGVSRQTIHKALKRLKDEGLLGCNDGYRSITLLDMPGLLRIAEED